MTKKSPFPGMDPFLERNPTWEDIHGWFIRELVRELVIPIRRLGLEIGVERTVYRRDSDAGLMLIGEPDFLSFQESNSGSGRTWDRSSGGLALAEPQAVHEVVLEDDEQSIHKQDFLVVREELRGYARVVAVVELLSPANKTGTYAPLYQEKRQHFLASQSHFLEIDLLRDGPNPSRDRFPELSRTPYFIFLARKKGMGWNEEGFPVRLQDPLPTIGLPLTADRPLLPLNLQAAFDSAFNLSAFVSDRLYGNLPGPALSSEDQEFVNNILSHRGPIETLD